jgi:hypothetical protein
MYPDSGTVQPREKTCCISSRAVELLEWNYFSNSAEAVLYMFFTYWRVLRDLLLQGKLLFKSSPRRKIFKIQQILALSSRVLLLPENSASIRNTLHMRCDSEQDTVGSRRGLAQNRIDRRRWTSAAGQLVRQSRNAKQLGQWDASFAKTFPSHNRCICCSRRPDRSDNRLKRVKL